MKISKVICPKCNKGEFLASDRKCNVCGAPMTDEFVEETLKKAYDDFHNKKEKMYKIHLAGNGSYISDCAAGVVGEISADMEEEPEL